MLQLQPRLKGWEKTIPIHRVESLSNTHGSNPRMIVWLLNSHCLIPYGFNGRTNITDGEKQIPWLREVSWPHLQLLMKLLQQLHGTGFKVLACNWGVHGGQALDSEGEWKFGVQLKKHWSIREKLELSDSFYFSHHVNNGTLKCPARQISYSMQYTHHQLGVLSPENNDIIWHMDHTRTSSSSLMIWVRSKKELIIVPFHGQWHSPLPRSSPPASSPGKERLAFEKAKGHVAETSNLMSVQGWRVNPESILSSKRGIFEIHKTEQAK